MRDSQSVIEGRNAVLEALRSEDTTIDRLFVVDGSNDGPIRTIIRESKKQKLYIDFVKKSRLDEMSETGKHQGVVAYVAAYEYAEVSDMLKKAEEEGKPPFIILLDGITDPHNLGAIIRSANVLGAHGVVIKKHGAVGLTATVAKASAGAINYTPVAKVTNLRRTMEELKEQGMWFVAADASGEVMYDVDMKGPLGLVIGDEGKGVSEHVLKECDFVARIPMEGEIESLNASVACAVLGYEIYRQRTVR